MWTFFPDPGQKQSIISVVLCKIVWLRLHAALKDDGVWRIATDIDDYALHVHEVMDARADFANDGEKTVSLATGACE